MQAYAIFGPGQIGGAPYSNRAHVYRKLDSLGDIGRLILGGGKGVDRLAQQWATDHGIPFNHAKPQSDHISDAGIPNAFMLRDAAMLAECDAVVVFTPPGLAINLRIISEAVLLKKNVMVFCI